MRRILSLALLVLAACHGHRPVIDHPVDRGFYAYAKTSDATFTIVAMNQHWLEAALREIGCGKDYVCLIEKTGDVFRVEQRPKGP